MRDESREPKNIPNLDGNEALLEIGHYLIDALDNRSFVLTVKGDENDDATMAGTGNADFKKTLAMNMNAFMYLCAVHGLSPDEVKNMFIRCLAKFQEKHG